MVRQYTNAACTSSNPSQELAEFLPHIAHLERLADEVVHGAPPNTVQSYADRYRYRAEATLDPTSSLARCSIEHLAYDPVTYLCAMNRFLGPLFVPLIKLLQLPKKRLLLYCPAPVERGAIVAFNLAEIVHAAYVHAGRAPGDVRVRGLVSLHDLAALQREAEQDADDRAWVAWTSDKIFMDKLEVFDVFLDVSAFAYPGAAPRVPLARPLATRVERSREPPAALGLSWSSRDLALYLELAEQERQYETILQTHERVAFDAWRTMPERVNTGGLRVVLPAAWTYLQQDARSLPVGYAIVWLACLRVWLAEWWLIRSQLQVAIPISLVFPLGVRADGGISTGIVDLTDTEMSESDEDEVESLDSVLRADNTHKSDVRSIAESLKDSARSIASEHDDESIYSQDDPLVAACGLGTPRPDRVHRSSSHASLPSPRRPPPRERTITPAHPRFNPCLAPLLPLETMSSVYLFTLWSSYVRAMHVQASAYLGERVEAVPTSHGESAPLLQHRAIAMSPRDFGALSLDASNELDRAMLSNILAQYGCKLRVTRGWWPWA